MTRNQLTPDQLDAIRRAAKQAKALQDAERADRAQARQAAKEQLGAMGAPFVYVLLAEERRATNSRRTRNLSNANLTATDVRGQMDGFLAGLALAIGQPIPYVVDLLDELVAEHLDDDPGGRWGQALTAVRGRNLPAPSAVRF